MHYQKWVGFRRPFFLYMKTFFCITALSLFTNIVLAQNTATGEAQIHRISSDTVYFGECYKGDTVEAVFKFTVKGAGKLFIRQVYAGCQCTIPQYPKDSLTEGSIDSVCLQFHSKNIHPGAVDKFAIIINSGAERTFRMIGEVKALPANTQIKNRRIRLKTSY